MTTDPTAMTLNAYARQWFLHHASTWPSSRRLAIRRHCLELIMPVLGQYPLSELSPDRVHHCLDTLGNTIKPQAACFVRTIVLEILEAALDDREITASRYNELAGLLATPATEKRPARPPHSHLPTHAQFVHTTKEETPHGT
jgi:hypothetical protein